MSSTRHVGSSFFIRRFLSPIREFIYIYIYIPVLINGARFAQTRGVIVVIAYFDRTKKFRSSRGNIIATGVTDMDMLRKIDSKEASSVWILVASSLVCHYSINKFYLLNRSWTFLHSDVKQNDRGAEKSIIRSSFLPLLLSRFISFGRTWSKHISQSKK